MTQRYKLVTKAYLGKGKDGYDSLAKGEVIGNIQFVIIYNFLSYFRFLSMMRLLPT